MIGPEIPPHLLQLANTASDDHNSISDIDQNTPEDLNSGKQEQDNETEDDYGPALPPDILLQRSNISVMKPELPSQTSLSSGLPNRTIGPSFPSKYEDSDEGSDDIGPKPLPPGLEPMHEKDAVTEFIEREERRRQNEEKAKEPKTLKREEWMLVPPSASDLLGNLDTTKLKARQFARTSGPVNKGDNSLWTETPAERQQRIADEVAGKKRRAVDVANEEALGVGSSSKKRSKREEESIKKGVDEYTRKMRGPSLVEQHSMREKSEDEDDVSKAIWDHTRDMAVGGRLLDDNKRNQMIHEAKGLGDRFGKGGSFL